MYSRELSSELNKTTLQAWVRWSPGSLQWLEPMCSSPDGMQTPVKGDTASSCRAAMCHHLSWKHHRTDVWSHGRSAMDEIRRAVERKGGGKVEYLQLDLACIRCGLILAQCYERAAFANTPMLCADVTIGVESVTTDSRSVERTASDFKQRGLPLDILVNNAAAIVPTDGVSVDGIELTMATNHFGEDTALLVSAVGSPWAVQTSS